MCAFPFYSSDEVFDVVIQRNGLVIVAFPVSVSGFRAVNFVSI